ncbi:hypothetical protein [Niabella hibiscisoli]|uniref:hypothetical protein n=1 Tax=Niabella hibiscisoli TaxID=1825928 RepID=UPI001F0E359C|nr:hypothetical protein [Niabella hibiscisoli]MCH5720762.1 hypothetical protein [Niabella hibiscisoli]
MNTFSQTPFWSDTFEDSGAPSIGSRTPSVQNFFPATPPYTRYFARVAPANIALQNGSYSNVQGARIWAAEDIDGALNGSNFGQLPNQTIIWSNINITGRTGISFRGLFACNNGPSTWENGNTGVGLPSDYMIVSYRINGGAWTDVVRVFATDGGQMTRETTGDEVGDGTPFASYTFTELSGYITGIGTTLDLRFSGHSNGTGTEEFAIDNFRLFEGISLPVTFGSIAPVIKNETLTVNWQTLTETNNDHFVIEASTDGTAFKQIGTLSSSAPKGYSDNAIQYSFVLRNAGTGMASMAAFGLLAGLLFLTKRNRKWLIFTAFGLIVFISCSKNISEHEDSPLFIRIGQVDKDGNRTYSKVIAAVKE